MQQFFPEVTRKNISLNSALKLLWDNFPENKLKEGTVITYQEIENIIGATHGSSRFGSIVSRWKNELLTIAGKVLICRVNIGYDVGDSHQKLSYAKSLQISGLKKIQKSSSVQDTVDTTKLSEEERVLYTKMRNANAALNVSYKRELEKPSI